MSWVADRVDGFGPSGGAMVYVATCQSFSFAKRPQKTSLTNAKENAADRLLRLTQLPPAMGQSLPSLRCKERARIRWIFGSFGLDSSATLTEAARGRALGAWANPGVGVLFSAPDTFVLYKFSDTACTKNAVRWSHVFVFFYLCR